MIGIYKITNQINNKVYVGQSINIYKRWSEHKAQHIWNNPNYHGYNYPLYRAFRKYGLDNFIFEVIEECDNDELNAREIYWIQYYDSCNNGYNQTIGGGGNSIKLIPIYKYDLFGRYLEEYPSIGIAASKNNNSYNNILDCLEHRKGTYQTKGFQWSYEKKQEIGPVPTWNPVVCFDLDGNRIAEYPNYQMAIDATHEDFRTIVSCCTTHKNSSHRYQWRYWNEVKELTKIETVLPYTDKKQVIQYNLKGEQIAIYNSLTEAEQLTGILLSNISTVCHGKAKSAGGYIWRFIDSDLPVFIQTKSNRTQIGKLHAVNQYDLEDNFLASYPSIREASIAIGHENSYGHISSCCTGKRKTAFGYKWRYANEE